MKKLNNEISSRINRSLILTLIHDNPMISRAKLSQITGLDRSTVTHILNYLLRHSLVNEIEKGKSGTKGGRCPILLKVNYNAKYFIIIEIGFVSMDIYLTNLSGEILYSWNEKIKKGRSLLANIDSAIEDIKPEIGDKFQQIVCAGVSVPGIVDAQNGNVCYSALHNWTNENVCDPLKQKYGFKFFLENDANAAAVGEMEKLIPERKSSMIYLIVRESPPSSEQILGIGGAIIFNQKLWHGSNFFAGEVSQTVNSLFKGSKITKWRDKAIKKGKTDNGTLTNLLSSVSQKKEDAIEAFDEIVYNFGKFCGEMVAFLDPGNIMIYIKSDQDTTPFWQKTFDAFRNHLPEHQKSVEFLKPQFADEAIKKGIIALAQKKIFARDPAVASILFQ